MANAQNDKMLNGGNLIMKQKILLIALVFALLLNFSACSSNQENNSAQNIDNKQTEKKSNLDNKNNNEKDIQTIKIGATPIPHAEILEFIKNDLSEKGFKLEIVEFTDYVMPNLALDEGSIDANFFQHEPYMNDFAKNHKLNLYNAGGIHIEPMGVYSNKIKSIDELKDGDKVSIPNDSTNGGRALLLLQKHNLIKLDEKKDLDATEIDIVENPLNLEFTAIDAAQLPTSIDDVTIAIINSNYALEAGFNPVKDSLIIEENDSPYVNIITVKTENKDSEKTKILIECLKTDKVKKFIEDKYNGAIIPSF